MMVVVALYKEITPLTSSTKNSKKQTAGPWLWPLVLIITGVVLLLDNFLLLGDFDVVSLLPLLLVVAGAQILVRGDLVPSTEARTFGITRGAVESGTLEISSGGIDVGVRALNREGRLIAGQYAANSRPALQVEDTYAHLRMDRRATPWYAFADWQIAVAGDLPWQVLVSTHLGEATLDLAGLIVHDVVAGTGMGDIRFTAPQECLGQIYLRATLGNIHVTTPEGYNVRVYVEPGPFLTIQADEYRYEQIEAGFYAATDPDPDRPLVEVRLSGTFGDVFLT